MAKNLFSVPIFFIAFRECLEAALIIAILLGLVEQIVAGGLHHTPKEELDNGGDTTLAVTGSIEEKEKEKVNGSGSGRGTNSDSGVHHDELPAHDASADPNDRHDTLTKKALIRKLRIQIFLGAILGLLIALSIGAAFIAVWFTKATNAWSTTEEVWEGIFSLIASIIIFIMGITMLKLDQAKTKWRIKLQRAFEKGARGGGRGAKTSRYALLILPLITVLREGLEAVVFIGGVALGQPASSIPIAALTGILCGLIVGFILYQFGTRSSLRVFLVVMTSVLLLIGAGLLSKAVGDFERNAFNKLLGADVDDSGGDGPGSYPVTFSVWHLNCCNPEDKLDSQGWSIFNAIFGWTNSATVGTVVSYIGYWIAVVAVLVWAKWREGRTRVGGRESRRGRERRERRATVQGGGDVKE